MGQTQTILWAGKKLDAQEEESLRHVVALLGRIERAGNEQAGEDRRNMERFLPENEHLWTPDQLEAGAHMGPWFQMDAAVEIDQ